jgi:hypothetical protein
MSQANYSDNAPDLGRIFAYDALDLSANQNGHLSEAQKQRLRAQLGNQQFAYTSALVVGVIISIGGFVVAQGIGLLIGVVFGLVFVGMAYVGARRTERLLNGAVYKLQGRPIMGEKGDFRDTDSVAHVQFGKVVFRLPPYAVKAFSSRYMYRVYYLPKADIIVAVERI